MHVIKRFTQRRNTRNCLEKVLNLITLRAAIDGAIMLKHLVQNPFLNYADLISAFKHYAFESDKARAG